MGRGRDRGTGWDGIGWEGEGIGWEGEGIGGGKG